MLGSVGHHLPAHRLTAGEKDVVKTLLEQAAVFLSAAGDYRHILWVKTGLEKLLEDPASVWSICAGLDHHGVPGGYGVYQGVHSEQKRVVPWAHHQNHPTGRGKLVAPGREVRQGSIHPLGPGEGAGVPEHIAEFGQNKPDLG